MANAKLPREKKAVVRKRKRKDQDQPRLTHLLNGVCLAVASVAVYWLHPPSYVQGLIIILDVVWVLQLLKLGDFQSNR